MKDGATSAGIESFCGAQCQLAEWPEEPANPQAGINVSA
jgi:hypothetical protein